MAVVGSAEVIVRAITDQVKRDIQKAFADARPVIAREGTRAGADYAKGFNNAFAGNLDIAGAVRPAVDQIGDDLREQLPADARQAGRAAGNEIADELEAGGGRGGRRGGNAAKNGFLNAFGGVIGGLQATLAGVANRIMGVANAFDLLGPAIANVVGMVSALVGGLFSVVAAAGQAAGALAVLPGLMGVLGMAFGAVSLASSGIGEAMKASEAATQAQTAATGASTAAAETNARATRRAADAQAELTAAREAEKDSQDALNRAKKLAAALAEKEEALEKRVLAQKKRLQDLINDPNASKKQIAAARRELVQNKDNLERVTDAHTEAMQKEYALRQEHNKKKKQLAAAAAAADKAGVGAAGGTTPAVTAASAALDKYNQAMAALTPQAREFVLALLDMKAEFAEVGDVIAARMFPQLTAALRLLQDSSFFDILKDNLGDTGEIIGDIGFGIAEAFTTGPNQRLFSTWLRNNNDILDTLNTTTEDGTTPIQSMVNLFLKLAVAIQPVTKRFAEWVGTLVTAADAGSSVESLTEFFNRAGNRAALLGDIMGNLFSILGTLGGVADKNGMSLLRSFRDSTAELDKFLKKLRKNGDLADYFNGVETNFRAVSRLIGQIGEEIIQLGDNEGVAAFSDQLTIATEKAGDIADKLSSAEVGDSFGNLIVQVTELVDTFTQTGQITVFLDTLALIANGIDKVAGVILKFPGMGAILAGLAAFRALKLAASLAGAAGGFAKLQSAIGKLIKMPFTALKNKIKGVSDVDPPVDPGADPADTAAAQSQGQALGKAMTQGIAAGITANYNLVDEAVDALLIRLATTNEVQTAALGRDMGKDIVDGVVLGIRGNLARAAAAADDIGDAVIAALKIKLGIASPSTVMMRHGDDTADGFILGIRQNAAQAFAAGQQLGTQAAAGARAGGASAAAAGAATGAAAGGAVRAPVAPVVAPKAVASTAKLGSNAAKAAGPLSRMGKAAGALSLAMLGLSLPVVAVIAGIALLIFGLKKLYGASPEFRAFVDGIVDKLKAMGEWFTKMVVKHVLPILNSFFGWINKNMPKIKAVFGAVFKGMSAGVKVAFGIISFLWNNVLKPIFPSMRDIIRGTIDVVVGIIEGFRDAFRRTGEVFSTIGDKISDVFNTLRRAAMTPIKFVVDTLWNNGLVAMADAIPGVDASGWKVDTSGWARGGWTGPGSTYQPAGIVHADEFVIRKSSRRKIEQQYPGLLDRLNRLGRMPGHAFGGRVLGYAEGGLVTGISASGSAQAESTNAAVRAANWAKDKALAVLNAVKEALAFLRSLPSAITSGLAGSSWGDLIINMPKATANSLVQYLNEAIPNGIPKVGDNPFGVPFPGVDFRARGGRVRAGMPYVVGELRPELFIPDSAGTIIPDLRGMGGVNTVQNLIETLGRPGAGPRGVTTGGTTRVTTGDRPLTININNPVPERAGMSTHKTLRDKATRYGWGV